MGVRSAYHVESPARDDTLACICTRASENTDNTLESIGTYLKDVVFHSYKWESGLMGSDKPINRNALRMFLSDHSSEFPKKNIAHD